MSRFEALSNLILKATIFEKMRPVLSSFQRALLGDRHQAKDAARKRCLAIEYDEEALHLSEERNVIEVHSVLILASLPVGNVQQEPVLGTLQARRSVPRKETLKKLFG